MWWVLTLVGALAGPIAAPTAAEPMSHRVSVTPSAGVSAGIVAREVTRPKPASVSFAPEGDPFVRDGKLVVRGKLVNTGSREAKVYLLSGSPLVLSPKNLVFRAPSGWSAPPEPPMTPEEVVLPPGASVTYESGLRLDRWDWPADGPVDVEWSFGVWDAPLTGVVTATLPE
jgi:hypothetical protein